MNNLKNILYKINATSIDDFVTENNIQQTDFIKIDAERSEYSVLAGGFESIKRFKLKMILANHPPLIENNKQSVESVYDALINSGFTIHYKSEKMMKEIFCRTRNFFDVQLSF